MLRCQCPSVCPSVRLSVTEVHWRIIANFGFKFRFQFTAHCGRDACGRARGKGSSPGRVEGSSRAMLATARPSCFIFLKVNFPPAVSQNLTDRFLPKFQDWRKELFNSCSFFSISQRTLPWQPVKVAVNNSTIYGDTSKIGISRELISEYPGPIFTYFTSLGGVLVEMILRYSFDGRPKDVAIATS